MENLVARTLRGPRDQRLREGGRAHWGKEGGPKGQNKLALRKLGSYILRDAPETWQSKVPDTRPTIQQFKEAVRRTDPPGGGTDAHEKGNRSPRKGGWWSGKGNGPPVHAWNQCIVANWRFARKRCTFWEKNGSFWAFWRCKIRRGFLKALEAKLHIPSPCLDA